MMINGIVTAFTRPLGTEGYRRMMEDDEEYYTIGEAMYIVIVIFIMLWFAIVITIISINLYICFDMYRYSMTETESAGNRVPHQPYH